MMVLLSNDMIFCSVVIVVTSLASGNKGVKRGPSNVNNWIVLSQLPSSSLSWLLEMLNQESFFSTKLYTSFFVIWLASKRPTSSDTGHFGQVLLKSFLLSRQYFLMLLMPSPASWCYQNNCCIFSFHLLFNFFF